MSARDAVGRTRRSKASSTGLRPRYRKSRVYGPFSPGTSGWSGLASPADCVECATPLLLDAEVLSPAAGEHSLGTSIRATT